MAQRARDLLRVLGVVPEVGDARLLAEVGDLGAEGFDVDDRADVGEGGAEGGDLFGEIEVDHVAASLPARAPLQIGAERRRRRAGHRVERS